MIWQFLAKKKKNLCRVFSALLFSRGFKALLQWFSRGREACQARLVQRGREALSVRPDCREDQEIGERKANQSALNSVVTQIFFSETRVLSLNSCFRPSGRLWWAGIFRGHGPVWTKGKIISSSSKTAFTLTDWHLTSFRGNLLDDGNHRITIKAQSKRLM